ncbi:MAG: type II toxin-antitoxin system death-on-curing family toxin [Thiohalomonadales bacterium]
MNEPVWVLDLVVASAHKMLLSEHGGSTGLRDEALLKSALARPKQRFAYKPESSIFELAASYSFGLVKNLPFIDENKRIAFTVAAIFMELNGFIFKAPEPEVVVFIENLASSEISEYQLAIWYQASSDSTT